MTKYLLLFVFFIGFIGCNESEKKEYEAQRNWFKYELRRGKKFTDPFHYATVAEENEHFTKYAIFTMLGDKYVTVKNDTIVSVWWKQ